MPTKLERLNQVCRKVYWWDPGWMKPNRHGYRDFFIGRYRVTFQWRRSCSGGFRKHYFGWSYGGWIGSIMVLNGKGNDTK